MDDPFFQRPARWRSSPALEPRATSVSSDLLAADSHVSAHSAHRRGGTVTVTGQPRDHKPGNAGKCVAFSPGVQDAVSTRICGAAPTPPATEAPPPGPGSSHSRGRRAVTSSSSPYTSRQCPHTCAPSGRGLMGVTCPVPRSPPKWDQIRQPSCASLVWEELGVHGISTLLRPQRPLWRAGAQGPEWGPLGVPTWQPAVL